MNTCVIKIITNSTGQTHTETAKPLDENITEESVAVDWNTKCLIVLILAKVSDECFH